MLKVLEALEKSTEYLNKHGIDNSRTNAELLLCHILNCKRLDLYLKFDQPLNHSETDTYRDYIARRAKFEPLQYITGEVEFYGYPIKVNPSVLIPRPETELLVETILRENSEENLMVFEVGTGSGCISIALGKEMLNAEIHGIDVSGDAIKTARENIKLNELNNVKLKERGIADLDTSKMGQYDILVSNPPYVSEDEYKEVQKEISDYEPAIAVTDFGDGFKFYRIIAEKGLEFLRPGGKVYFETGYGMAENLVAILEEYGYQKIGMIKDYADIKRIVKGVKE